MRELFQLIRLSRWKPGLADAGATSRRSLPYHRFADAPGAPSRRPTIAQTPRRLHIDPIDPPSTRSQTARSPLANRLQPAIDPLANRPQPT